MARTYPKQELKRSRLSKFDSYRGVNVAKTVIAVSTVTVTLTLSGPVRLSGIPQVLSAGTNAGLPVSATQTSPTVLSLVYAATQAGNTFTIPSNDPAIRTPSGGFVTAGTFSIG